MRALATFVVINILLSNLRLSYAVDNTHPRLDVEGKLMDIHDGNVIKGF